MHLKIINSGFKNSDYLKQNEEQLASFFCNNSDNFDYDFCNITKTTDDLNFIQSKSIQKWCKQFKTHIIIGTGGSSLAAQAIYSISSKTKDIRFLSNMDIDTFESIFCDIDILNIGFLCVSKSGETLETIVQTLLCIEKVIAAISIHSKEHNILNVINERFVFITEDKSSTIKNIANNYQCLCIEHPKNIGGRFSIFSIVGMLPAYLCGISPYDIRNGGLNFLLNKMNLLSIGLNFLLNNFNQNIKSHVSFLYSDKLYNFGAWISQLYAESSGKQGSGITPLTSIGAVDQHSHLQLYLEGANDKSFSFFVEHQNEYVKIPKNFTHHRLESNNLFPNNFDFIKGKPLSEIFLAQSSATMHVLSEKNRSVRVFEFPQMTPYILGELFMYFMLEITAFCKILSINPFDQPAVERGKFLTKEFLK